MSGICNLEFSIDSAIPDYGKKLKLQVTGVPSRIFICISTVWKIFLSDIRYNSVEYWHIRFMQKRLAPNA